MRWAMRFSSLWLLKLAIYAPLCLASVTPLPSRSAPSPTENLRHSDANKITVTACAASRPAQALATPDPLLDSLGDRERISVSFVVGIDGRVHSPVILESAGSDEDSRILRVLSLWRYRPATCNSAPTEMESKIEFTAP